MKKKNSSEWMQVGFWDNNTLARCVIYEKLENKIFNKFSPVNSTFLNIFIKLKLLFLKYYL